MGFTSRIASGAKLYSGFGLSNNEIADQTEAELTFL
jgi:hypothetical protein